MLKLTAELYEFCPTCGAKLQSKFEDHQQRVYCEQHGTFYPHVAASSCAVMIKDDKLLLVKRLRQPYAGTWMFPAGYVEYGEHPQETLIREVKEETGLDVVSSSIIDVLQTTDDDRAPGHFAFFYLAVLKDGEHTKFNLDLDENSAVEWFDLSKPLPEIGFKTHQEIVKRIISGKLSIGSKT